MSMVAIGSQGVPNHKSYVVLFKYYGGGEVDYFEVARNFGAQDSVAEPTSTGECDPLTDHLYMYHLLVQVNSYVHVTVYVCSPNACAP